MLWRQNGGRERNANRNGCERRAKIPVKTFQSRKESILNCLLMENRGLYTKVCEGLDQEDQIKKISNLLEEGRILVGNKYAGVTTAVACLGELTIT